MNLHAPFLDYAGKIIEFGGQDQKMENTNESDGFEDGTDDDAFVTPDLSVFRTKLPRPTSTMRHLVLAAITFLVALIAAIFYAEP